MEEKKKSSKLGIGLLIGSVLGGLAAFFLTPGSGPKNRKMVLKKLEAVRKKLADVDVAHEVKKIYGEVTQETVRLYGKVRKELIRRIDDMRKRYEDLDKEKYKKLVDEVVDEVKKDTQVTAEKLLKIKDSLLKDWERVANEGTPKIKKNS